MGSNKRDREISEAVYFLLENRGPIDGRVHPTKKRFLVEDLEEIIATGEGFGLPQGFRPYHVRHTYGVWNNQQYIDEVLLLRGNELLEKYNGDMIQLIGSVQGCDIEVPIKTEINGVYVEISMSVPYQTCRESPFEFLKAFLELKGWQDEFSDFRPFHLSMAKQNISDDEGLVNELVEKKMDALLNEYNGNFIKMFTSVNSADLRKPFIANINGRSIEVGVGHLTQMFPKCFDMFSKYIELKGVKDRFHKLKHYHVVQHASNFTSEELTEILVDKLERLIEEKYDGNFVSFLQNARYEEMKQPIEDTIDGVTVEVSTQSALKLYNGRFFDTVVGYLEAKGIWINIPIYDLIIFGRHPRVIMVLKLVMSYLSLR